jgi:hypothetical protein
MKDLMDDGESKTYRKADLYTLYGRWAETQGEKVVACTALVEMLKELGFTEKVGKQKQKDGSFKSTRVFKFDPTVIDDKLSEFASEQLEEIDVDEADISISW